MLPSKEPILKNISDEFKVTENIDLWHEMGRPQEINDSIYRQSPMAAMFKKIGKQRLLRKNES